MTTPLNQLTGYTTSRDYDLLIRLMQSGHRLVCFVNYRFPLDPKDEPPCRDVCTTRYEPPHKNPEEHYFAAQSRGIGYAGGLHLTPEAFQKHCRAVDLEFILPTVNPVNEVNQGANDVHTVLVALQTLLNRTHAAIENPNGPSPTLPLCEAKKMIRQMLGSSPDHPEFPRDTRNDTWTSPDRSGGGGHTPEEIRLAAGDAW